MPDMVLVISEVDTYIIANAGETGQQILDGLSPQRKRHQVKQAIARLIASGDITETPLGNLRWYDNTYVTVV
jgi:hypothetical protein